MIPPKKKKNKKKPWNEHRMLVMMPPNKKLRTPWGQSLRSEKGPAWGLKVLRMPCILICDNFLRIRHTTECYDSRNCLWLGLLCQKWWATHLTGLIITSLWVYAHFCCCRFFFFFFKLIIYICYNLRLLHFFNYKKNLEVWWILCVCRWNNFS